MKIQLVPLSPEDREQFILDDHQLILIAFSIILYLLYALTGAKVPLSNLSILIIMRLSNRDKYYKKIKKVIVLYMPS